MLLMTPRLAFFYGGLVGRKSVSGHHACGHTKVVLNVEVSLRFLATI
jgi:ammonia channel protein AmtB